MLQAIILDFDGVIADTEKLHLRAFQDVLRRHGIELSAEEYYERYLGLDDGGVLDAIMRQRGVARDESRVTALLGEKADRYGALIAGTTVLFEGVETQLRAWGHDLPLAIASGSLRSEIEFILGPHALLACFAAIVSAEDVTRGKPAPDPYLAALDRLNRTRAIGPRSVVAVDDSIPGIEAARSAGMWTIGVATNQPPSALSSADMVVDSLAHLELSTLRTLTGER